MRYFIDTEFVETPGHIELISIGIVCEDDRELYLVNTEADLKDADDWVKDNVLLKMPEYRVEFNDLKNYSQGSCFSMKEIRDRINFFCGQHNNVIEQCEFWGDWASYDWVIFCWIFGKMIDLPKGFPMFIRDIQQLKETKHLSDAFFPKGDENHNALGDAKTTRDRYNYLMNLNNI